VRFFRFFPYHPFFFFSFLFAASARYRSDATALRPPYHTFYAALSSPPPQRTFSHTKQGLGAHEFIPSCSFAHLSYAMASSWLYPFSHLPSAMTITIFFTAHLPPTTHFSPGEFRLRSPTPSNPSPFPISQKHPAS